MQVRGVALAATAEQQAELAGTPEHTPEDVLT